MPRAARTSAKGCVARRSCKGTQASIQQEPWLATLPAAGFDLSDGGDRGGYLFKSARRGGGSFCRANLFWSKNPRSAPELGDIDALLGHVAILLGDC